MKLQFKHQKFQADAAKAVVDVFAGQPEARGDPGFSGGAAPQLAAGLLQLRAGCPVNTAVHSAPSHQGGVGGVDNGVGFHPGNVLPDHL